MAILISDIGSSKSSWALLSNSKIEQFETVGFNPNYQTEAEITNILNEVVRHFNIATFDELFLYGAGIDSIKSKQILESSIAKSTIITTNISLENDLLAAARCCFSDTENGVIAILGTGSNIREYNNGQLLGESHSLGYILGDEGGGVGFGRYLCKAFVYGELSIGISNILSHYGYSKESIINSVYHKPYPQKYFANFARVLFEFKADDSLKSLLKKNFTDFIESHVLKIDNIQNKDLKFVGSMAYYFQEELNETAKTYNLKISTIHQNPLNGLIEYHKKHI